MNQQPQTNAGQSEGNVASGETGDGAASVMQSLEDAIQAGISYARENPAITALGVASVAALVVIASKGSTTKPSSLAIVERRIRDAASSSATHAGSAVDTISEALGRAFTSDPKNVELLQATVSDWISSARSRIEPIVENAISRR